MVLLRQTHRLRRALFYGLHLIVVRVLRPRVPNDGSICLFVYLLTVRPRKLIIMARTTCACVQGTDLCQCSPSRRAWACVVYVSLICMYVLGLFGFELSFTPPRYTECVWSLCCRLLPPFYFSLRQVSYRSEINLRRRPCGTQKPVFLFVCL